MRVTDTYEAAYYMVQGAKLVSVDNSKTRFKRGRIIANWECELEGVTGKMINAWRTGTAACNIDDFKRERLRIKKFVKKKALFKYEKM